MEDRFEENNELSDILLEQKNSNKAAKIKRLIVIAVLLILLFILVLMIMRLISKPEDTSNTLTDSILQQNLPKSSIDANTNPYSTYGIIEDNNDTIANDALSNDTDFGIGVIEENDINTSSNVIQTPSAVKNQPQQTTTVQPKNSDNNSSSKPTNDSVKSGHYIQVGAFSSAPNKSFLNNIVKKGYKYNLSNSKQLTTVLIGPFSSETAARAELSAIKSDISKNAFYKRVP